MEGKEEIRGRLIKERDSINHDLWNKKTNDISRKILRSAFYKDAEYILLYADFHGEVGTNIILEDALLKDKKVYLPKVLENFDEAKMDFFKIINSVELIEGYKGIKEPTGDHRKCFDYSKVKEKNILMLVPGVAFDKNGNRLGYGKGYYDNYLKDKPDILTVALCFSLQIQESLPCNDGDIKINHLISETTAADEIKKIRFRK